MLLKVAFQSTMELDVFIGEVQKYGKTNTQIVFFDAGRSEGSGRHDGRDMKNLRESIKKWYIQGSFSHTL